MAAHAGPPACVGAVLEGPDGALLAPRNGDCSRWRRTNTAAALAAKRAWTTAYAACAAEHPTLHGPRRGPPGPGRSTTTRRRVRRPQRVQRARGGRRADATPAGRRSSARRVSARRRRRRRRPLACGPRTERGPTARASSVSGPIPHRRSRSGRPCLAQFRRCRRRPRTSRSQRCNEVDTAATPPLTRTPDTTPSTTACRVFLRSRVAFRA